MYIEDELWQLYTIMKVLYPLKVHLLNLKRSNTIKRLWRIFFLTKQNPNPPNELRLVMLKSRRLTDVKTRYSQCEKEALAAVCGCESVWIYLIGNKFRLLTDNKAIQLIVGNATSRPPARIERWALRLSQLLTSGILNPAGYLSRHPDSNVT